MGKSWIDSDIRPRKEMRYIRPKVLKKGNETFVLCNCKRTVGLRRMNRNFDNYIGANNCTLLTSFKNNSLYLTCISYFYIIIE